MDLQILNFHWPFNGVTKEKIVIIPFFYTPSEHALFQVDKKNSKLKLICQPILALPGSLANTSDLKPHAIECLQQEGLRNHFSDSIYKLDEVQSHRSFKIDGVNFNVLYILHDCNCLLNNGSHLKLVPKNVNFRKEPLLPTNPDSAFTVRVRHLEKIVGEIFANIPKGVSPFFQYEKYA